MGWNEAKLLSPVIVALIALSVALVWAPLATGASYTKYATRFGSDGWTNPGKITGHPDGQGAESPIADSLSIWGYGFGTETGEITRVVIKVVYRVDVPAVDDKIYLEYSLNPLQSGGATFLSWVPTDTDWTEKSLDITSDDSVNGGSWDWGDIQYLYVFVTNSSEGDPDSSVVFVDAIYIEVTTAAAPETSPPTPTTPSFDFSLSAAPDILSLQQTGSATTAVNVRLTTGVPVPVFLSGGWVGIAPTGVESSLNPPSGTPNFTSKLTFSATKEATPGSFVYQVKGISGNLTRTVNVFLEITELKPPASPELLFPDDGVTLDTVTPAFDWSDVAASEYHLEIATDREFSHIILTKVTMESSATLSQNEALSYGTVYYWRVRGRNAAGLGDWSQVRSFTAKIGAPKVLGFEIAAGAKYVNSTTVQLSITALNAAQMSFSSDGITWSDWEDFQPAKSLTISPPEGTKDIYVRVRDAAGDVGQSVMASVIFDQTPPVTRHFLSGSQEGGAFRGSVVVSLVAEDLTSGVWETRYRVDNQDWVAGNTFVIAEDGKHVVEYYSVDRAGNVEATRSFEVTVFTPTALPPIIQQYWWAMLAGVVAVGIFSTVIYRRLRLAGRLKQIRREKAELPKLKRQAEIRYFKEGTISRQEYDKLVEEYERRLAELEREERLLLKRLKGKKAK
ncbi:MAG: LapA family protein [Candidatus Hadarchaeum sp.]|uniref:LapA family protein n=1 Tax=Candidatus Hadarchaeum sp. TaxID=2883567 RepID=UPI003D0D3363